MAVTYPLNKMVNEIVDEPTPMSLGSSIVSSSIAKDDGVDLFWQRPFNDFRRRFGSTVAEWDIVDNMPADVRRISTEDAKGLCNLLSKVLIYDPERRISG